MASRREGQARRDDPEVQALVWSLISATAKPGDSGFWTMAGIAEIFRLSSPRSMSRDEGGVSLWLASLQEVLAGGSHALENGKGVAATAVQAGTHASPVEGCPFTQPELLTPDLLDLCSRTSEVGSCPVRRVTGSMAQERGCDEGLQHVAPERPLCVTGTPFALDSAGVLIGTHDEDEWFMQSEEPGVPVPIDEPTGCGVVSASLTKEEGVPLFGGAKLTDMEYYPGLAREESNWRAWEKKMFKGKDRTGITTYPPPADEGEGEEDQPGADAGKGTAGGAVVQIVGECKGDVEKCFWTQTYEDDVIEFTFTDGRTHEVKGGADGSGKGDDIEESGRRTPEGKPRPPARNFGQKSAFVDTPKYPGEHPASWTGSHGFAPHIKSVRWSILYTTCYNSSEDRPPGTHKRCCVKWSFEVVIEKDKPARVTWPPTTHKEWCE